MDKSTINYITSFIIVLITATSGSFFTTKNVHSEWYKCIKPKALTPPNYVFPIVWTVIYVLLFLAFKHALDAKSKLLIICFVLSFILQVLWCYLYFTKRNVKLAFYIILIHICLAVVIISSSIYNKFYNIASLVGPYLLWISFATVLNYMSIYKLEKCDKFLW